MNAPYKYDEGAEEAPRFTALGIMNVQGDSVLAVVTIENNKLVATNVVHSSSSYMVECKKTLLKLLEQVLK